MRVDVVTIFPQIFTPLRTGVVGRAVEHGTLSLYIWNPRDYARGKHRTVDGRPFGGGSGMVMKVEPFAAALDIAEKCQKGRYEIIYPSPQGDVFKQSIASELALLDGIIFIAGRYSGLDERLVEKVIDRELSLGDYVISGGELAVMVMVDAVVRHMPHVLGNIDSLEGESFTDGLLEYPHYTRPEVFHGKAIPSVLKSGHHENIRRWRIKQSLGRTYFRRPDLLAGREWKEGEKELLAEYMHDNNLVVEEKE